MVLKQLEDLYREYRDRFEGEKFVFGHGNAGSKLVLIGEAPGRNEVKYSRPFSGAAGRYLDEFLSLAGIEREKIYITNVIKYRLSKRHPKTGRESNRPATREEIEMAKSFLLSEIDILRPTCIATLGNIPLRAVTGDYSLTIGERHGRISSEKPGKHTCLLFPLYHPAGIIYNRGLKEVCEMDFMVLGRFLSENGI